MSERTRTAIVWSVATGAACVMAAISGALLAWEQPLPAACGLLSAAALVLAVWLAEVAM